ncbi:hypothetical protein D3C80_2025920 [compost metagenome]
MKVLVVITMLMALSGCVTDSYTSGRLIFYKNDFQLAHRCQVDPYKPECSVN